MQKGTGKRGYRTSGNQDPGPRTGLTPDAEERRVGSLFKPGHHVGSKPGGSPRRALTERFLSALLKDFEAHGEDAISKVRENDPATYIRVVARMVPLNLTTGEDEKVITEVVYRWAASDDSESSYPPLLSTPVAGSAD